MVRESCVNVSSGRSDIHHEEFEGGVGIHSCDKLLGLVCCGKWLSVGMVDI